MIRSKLAIIFICCIYVFSVIPFTGLAEEKVVINKREPISLEVQKDSQKENLQKSDGDTVPVEGIVINNPEITIETGASFFVDYTIYPENATNKNVRFELSENRLLMVGGGEFFGKMTGPDTLTVITEDGGYSAECTVTVKQTSDNPLSSYPCGANGSSVYANVTATGTAFISGSGTIASTSPNSNPINSNCKEIIRTVIISGSVKNIGPNMFYGCERLMRVIILTDSIENIGEAAFYGCSRLNQITLPDSIKTIEKQAFYKCSALTSINLPYGLLKVGADAFTYCTGITSMELPSTISEIELFAFPHLDYVKGSSDVLVLLKASEHTFSGIVEIEEGSLEIPDDLFSGYSQITNIRIPGTVLSIGNNAFKNCTGLLEVSLPDSIETIGESAFYGCEHIETIDLPDSLVLISPYLFYGCTALVYVNITNSVTQIGEYSFYDCQALEELLLPNGLTKISASAFRNCQSLTDVVIPESVTSIGSYAFNGCSSLESVYIPNSVTQIGSSAFYNCENLTDIKIGGYPLRFARSTINLKGSIEIIEGSVNIPASAFSGNSQVKSIKIPQSVTTIGANAFKNCVSLEYASLPIEIVSDVLTYSKNTVKTIVLVGEGEEISDSLFDGYTVLEDITIPDSVVMIRSSAFSGCSALSVVNGASNVEYIGSLAFAGSGLESFPFGEKVFFISGTAFADDPSFDRQYPLYLYRRNDADGDDVLDYQFFTGITLEENDYRLNNGSVAILHVATAPAVSDGYGIIWSSDDTSIVEVDQNGTITGKNVGTAKITVTTIDGYFSDICQVSVSVFVSSVEIDEDSIQVPVGTNYQISFTIDPENATNKNVIWTSSDESIATVNDYGNVVGIKKGKTVISVTTEDGDFTDSVEVDVTVAAEGIYLNKEKITLNIDNQETLIATVMPEEASNKNLVWTTSNRYVATVNDEGLVTGIDLGTATITATTEDGQFTASCFVIVDAELVSVRLDRNEMTLIKGEMASLSVSIVPEGLLNDGVCWTSSDETVVTVDETGIVTAVGSGNAVITVTTENGSKTDTCNVTVIVYAESVKLDRTEMTLEKGAEDILFATVLPEDTSNKSVIWTSSDESIVTVDQTGKVTALQIGTAIITATTEDGGFTDNCEVSVPLRALEASLKAPDKIHYLEGKDGLDVSGGEITISFNDESTDIITVTDDMVEGFDNSIVGEQQLRVLYKDYVFEYTVYIDAKAVISVSIAQIPYKQIYLYKTDSLDVTGGIITISYNNDTSEDMDITLEMASGFDNSVVGSQMVCVTYEGFSDEYLVKVNLEAPEITELCYLEDEGVLSIEWSTITEASNYNLYRRINNEIEWTEIQSCTDLTSAIDTAEPGKTYYFAVCCADREGNTISEYSSVKSIIVNPFTDVKESASYYKYVIWAYQNSVITGTSETTFSPNDDCKRCDLAVMLYRMYGKPSISGMTIPFTDVKTTAYYYKAVVWAYNKGYIKGTSATSFKPEGSITRQDMVVILWRINGSKVVDIENPFTDVDSSSYAYKAIMWAYKNKITSGTSSTKFSPKKNCLRYQLAVFLNKFNNIQNVIS